MEDVHLELKAAVVLPPVQQLIHSLNQPSDVTGETRESLIELERNLRTILWNEKEENRPPVKHDDIAFSYLKKKTMNLKMLLPRGILLLFHLCNAFPFFAPLCG